MTNTPHHGDLLALDMSAIELRVLAFMTDLGAVRRYRMDAKEECLNALMGDRRARPST